METSELLIYQAENGAIQLRADANKETLWATQKQMAEMFGVTPQNITLHLKNIFKDEELSAVATCKQSLHVQKEGKRNVSRKINEYNLDIMIAVGYRINSVVGTKFRQWATKTLKQHITQGYTINEQLLAERKQVATSVLEDIKAFATNSKVQASDVLELISAFTDTWFSLQSQTHSKRNA